MTRVERVADMAKELLIAQIRACGPSSFAPNRDPAIVASYWVALAQAIIDESEKVNNA